MKKKVLLTMVVCILFTLIGSAKGQIHDDKKFGSDGWHSIKNVKTDFKK